MSKQQEEKKKTTELACSKDSDCPNGQICVDGKCVKDPLTEEEEEVEG